MTSKFTARLNIQSTRERHGGKYKLKKDSKNTPNANFPEAITNEQFEVYFHGTDTGGDEHIIENGIEFDKGKEAQYFSDGNGFYVTNNFDEADTWANRRFPWG